MAGGTGGHVFPALAVAAELKSMGHEIVWMGAPDSFEAKRVPPHGIPMEFIRVSGLRGKGVMKLVLAPLLILRALIDALRALRRQQPQVVLGMGGFAAGPGGLAAWLTRRPLVIHEQNAAAGFTNLLLARIAKRVLEAFPRTFSRALTVGNPVCTSCFVPSASRSSARSCSTDPRPMRRTYVGSGKVEELRALCREVHAEVRGVRGRL